MVELTYKDFKIGQYVVCSKIDDFKQHLTVGKKYIIEDLDFHFPNSNNKISMFFNISHFSDIKIIRKLKLQKIINNGSL